MKEDQACKRKEGFKEKIYQKTKYKKKQADERPI